jgi:ATP-dependent Clp protease ATP-binding subunit ClpA
VFERFTTEARATVICAQTAARELGHRSIGTEHLLLALLRQPDGTAQRVLRANGLGETDVLGAVRDLAGPPPSGDLDADALRAIGIDLDAVREKVEATFGPGALDQPDPRHPGGRPLFSPAAKKVLELSLRETLRLKQRTITDAHILLAIIRDPDSRAARIITAAGIDLTTLRTATEHELRRAG